MKHHGLLLLFSAALSAQPAPESIKLDNEFVRVLFLTDQPGAKTPLHQHEFDRVMIYLDPIRLVLRYQDGEVDRQTWRKGQVAWSPGRRLPKHLTCTKELRRSKKKLRGSKSS